MVGVRGRRQRGDRLVREGGCERLGGARKVRRSREHRRVVGVGSSRAPARPFLAPPRRSQPPSRSEATALPTRDPTTRALGRGRPPPAPVGDPTARRRSQPPSDRSEMGEACTVNLEHEDVCPVLTLPRRRDSTTISPPSARRSATRSGARSAAPRPPASCPTTRVDPLADLEAFIDLHQKRWGDDGLFPPTAGGEQAACSSGACSSCSGRTAR